MQINSGLMEMMNVVKVCIIGSLEQILCSVVQLMLISRICISCLPSLHLSLHDSIGWTRHFEEGLKLCLMTNSQFSAFSLPPFQLLSNTCSLSAQTTIAQQQRHGPLPPQPSDQTPALSRARGSATVCMHVCVHVCFLGGESVYVHISMTLIRMH